MSKRLDFLKEVGEEGLPKGIDSKYQDVWDTYLSNKSEPDRILSVLGFLHLMTQAGLRRGKGPSESPKIYGTIRGEEFSLLAKAIADRLVKLHVFDVLRTYKSAFVLDKSLRGNVRTFRITLCMEPKRTKEHLDGALAKLRGLLYRDELPMQLREVWKSLPLNSRAKAKSMLRPYTDFITDTSPIGFLPIHIDNTWRLSAIRAKDEMLIVRIEIQVDVPEVPWYTTRKHDEVLKSLLTKALMKLKG